jgi:polysaccharide biosynthesis transport protein
MNSNQGRFETEDSGLDLHWVWSILQRRGWIIAVCVAVSIVLAFVITSSLPANYEASTTLMVQPAQDPRTSDYEALLIGSRQALAYADMTKSQMILNEVISRLTLPENANRLLEKIFVEAIKDTQLIRLTVNDASPQRAALIANTLGQTLSETVQKLQSQRYSSSIKNLDEKIKGYSETLAEAQNQAITIEARRSEVNAEIDRLATQNNNHQLDYQSLQQTRNALQLAISQQTNLVKLIDPVHSMTDTGLDGTAATFLLMFDPSMLSGTSSLTGELFGERLKSTYGPMIKGQSVLSSVITQLDLNDYPENLANKITLKTVYGSPMLRVDVDYGNPTQSIKVADAISTAFLNQIHTQLTSPYTSRLTEMQQQLDNLEGKMDQTQADIQKLSVEKSNSENEYARINTLIILTTNDLHTAQGNYDQLQQTEVETADQLIVAVPAQVPERPIDRRLINISLAAIVGLMLGVGLIFVLEQVDDRIRSRKDVPNLFGVKLISTISPVPQADLETFVDSMPSSIIAEDFRLLATKIRLEKDNNSLKALLVTSPVSSEGKTMTVANLAIALARSGLEVIVIDADLRRPRLHQVFNLPQENGLTESLLNGNVNGYLHTMDIKGLSILTSGNIPDEPIQTLNSPAMDRLLKELALNADIVLIDCPPVLPVADTSVLATLVDSALLVLRKDISESKPAHDALESLCASHVHVIGMVLLGVSNHGGKYNQYYRSSPVGEK